MGALRSIAVALALQFATAAHADPIERWRPYIEEASRRYAIPAAWIERVMRAESAGRTSLNGRPITSRAGAMGLMQLMPGTWAQMRTMLRLGPNPHDPRDNILAGTAYLRLMHDQFGYPGLFAAYNAGPARYAAVLAGRRALPGETRAYLALVAGEAIPVSQPAQVVSSNPIFFALHSAPSAQPDSRSGSASLFVPLGTAALAAGDREP